MEQDCLVGLYRSVGRPVGEQFSTDDVSHLFGKVFHEPSNAQEVHAAIVTVSNGHSGWTCAGQNVLDVLREMEKRRVKDEKLHWEKQLLNAMNYQSSQVKDTFITEAFTEGNTGQLCTHNNKSLSSKMKKSEWRPRKLRRASRQSWARLVVGGLQSLLPVPQAGPSGRSSNRAWGWVTLSDLLLLVEVKYDAVSRLLHQEMLREHHSRSMWAGLSPWEQQQEEVELGNSVEQALESHDLLHLAALPGAFSIYRFQDQSWSAVSFLCEVDALCRTEKQTLEVLAHRLDMENMKVLCLHLRLATLRAQRQKSSYSAAAAARQSWDTWPDVSSPVRAEQALILLKSQDNEQKVEPVEGTHLQAVLQLLIQNQEQERQQLLNLLQGLSLRDVQESGRTEDTTTQAESRRGHVDLRSSCVKRLHQVYSSLKTLCPSEPQLQECALQLLMDLLKLQEVQASALLPALVDKTPQALQSLQEELRSALQAQALPNLLQLLTSDQPSAFTEDLPQSSSCEDTCSPPGAPEGDLEENETTAGAPEPDVCTGCGAAMAGLPYLEVLCAPERATRTEEQGAPEEEAGKAPEEEPGRAPEEEASRVPYEEPGRAREEEPGRAPKEEPGRAPEEEPGRAPEEEPGRAPKEEPGRAPEEELGRSPEEEKDRAPEDSLIALAWSKPPGGSQEVVDEEHLLPLDTHLQQTICESEGGQHCSTEQNEVDENAVKPLVAEDLLSSTNSSSSEQQIHEDSSDVDREDTKETALKEQEQNTSKKLERPSEPVADEQLFSVDLVSEDERGQTMRSLVDLQRKVEQRQQRDRERQLLKVQERLSFIQSRKADEDPLGLKDRLKLLTHDLPQEDVQQQKVIVKERLEQLRRERSYILQSKRDKNTAGFKELLGPVQLHHTKIQEDKDSQV